MRFSPKNLPVPDRDCSDPNNGVAEAQEHTRLRGYIRALYRKRTDLFCYVWGSNESQTNKCGWKNGI